MNATHVSPSLRHVSDHRSSDRESSRGSSSEQNWTNHKGAALKVLQRLEETSIDCIETSAPYAWLRNLGVGGQIGLDETIGDHIASLAGIMNEGRGVLRSEGVAFLSWSATGYSGNAKSDGRDAKGNWWRFGFRAIDRSEYSGWTPGASPQSESGVEWPRRWLRMNGCLEWQSAATVRIGSQTPGGVGRSAVTSMFS